MQFEQLGPYRLERAVGRGGMGAVYAAAHVDTGEPCAIKVLSGAIADDEHFRERFKSEVETLQTLKHPNIVRLYGYGEQDGRLFYAMELVEGVNLQEKLQQKRFPWLEVIDHSIQICAALKHAHDHGVIHRDLKPANLLLTPDGRIKLTDFGIAKAFGASHLTAAGGVLGTADYMSPEQAEGAPITNRTDLYSLGCVMYAMLTRKPPFTGRSVAEVIHSLKFDEPKPVSSRAFDTPVELEELIMQLLSKGPDERIANAMLVGKRLQAMQHGLKRRVEKDLEEEEEYRLAEAEEDDPKTRMGGALPTSARPTVGLPTSVENDVTQATDLSKAVVEVGDETVVTEVSRNGEAGSPDTLAHRSPQTHFVTVDDSQGGAIERSIAKPADTRKNHLLSTIGLIALLVVVVAGIVWGLQPPSANKLFGRIQTVAELDDDDALIEVKSTMEDFVRIYPQDPRSPEVSALLRDYDAHRLWRRLERRIRKRGALANLTTIQSTYVEAFRARELDPGKARALFLSIASLTVSALEDEVADDQECVKMAEHCAERLAPELPLPTK